VDTAFQSIAAWLATQRFSRHALKMKEIYLDWASAAPVSIRAKRAFSGALEAFGNPSSPHAEGVRAHRILEDARHSIAHISGVKQDSIIFTSGATEANNLAIRGHINALRTKGRDPKDMHLLYLPTMHTSVVETMHVLEREGIQIEAIALTEGAIDLAQLAKQIRPETVLVSVDVICGETGTRWAVRDVRRVIDKAHAPRALLHVDASQAPFVESIEHTHLGADLITLDAQKVGGVRGIGALIRANSLIPLTPLIYGGGQEYGLRPGTENPALAAAFAVALEEAENGREEFVGRARSARLHLLESLTAIFPDMLINVGKESAPHILNISFPNLDTDYAVMLLSEKGFAVSTKSACETNEEGSRAVNELFDDPARARSTLRISWGPATKTSELNTFAKSLVATITWLQEHTI
jgi:cysteine desulfurase